MCFLRQMLNIVYKMASILQNRIGRNKNNVFMLAQKYLLIGANMFKSSVCIRDFQLRASISTLKARRITVIGACSKVRSAYVFQLRASSTLKARHCSPSLSLCTDCSCKNSLYHSPTCLWTSGCAIFVLTFSFYLIFFYDAIST